jgi:hypothetical protein
VGSCIQENVGWQVQVVSSVVSLVITKEHAF